jgi:hypothetical protein
VLGALCDLIEPLSAQVRSLDDLHRLYFQTRLQLLELRLISSLLGALSELLLESHELDLDFGEGLDLRFRDRVLAGWLSFCSRG